MRFRLMKAVSALAMAGMVFGTVFGSGSNVASASTSGGQFKIGLSLATLDQERWGREKNVIVAEGKALGAQVLVQSAHGDEALQESQAENLITEGVNVLIVIAQNGQAATSIVRAAHNSHVKVIAYDRFIKGADFYISYNTEKIGELQAQYALHLAPKGNYILIGGSPTDPNAYDIRSGQMKKLHPYIQKGNIKVVTDQWAQNWSPQAALGYVENGLTKSHNNVTAVITSNDGTAGAAVQALTEQHLQGKVAVTGLDADIAACQRIVEGTQSMTVYRDFDLMASKAAKIAAALAKGEKTPFKTELNNGVPSLILTEGMYAVDKNNMYNVVIKSGWLKLGDVYKNVPRNQWPAQK